MPSGPHRHDGQAPAAHPGTTRWYAPRHAPRAFGALTGGSLSLFEFDARPLAQDGNDFVIDDKAAEVMAGDFGIRRRATS